MEIIQINPRKFTSPTAEQRKVVQDKIKQLRKESEKLVTGMFEFPDAPGGWIDFDYRFLPGEPITKVKITHGEMITIPVILAKHLNNTYKIVRSGVPELDEQGRIKKLGAITRYSRTRFIQMDLMDDPLTLEKATLAIA